jgi:LDH2 family malate/lactate/ureidoglycolate dehydrogenase
VIDFNADDDSATNTGQAIVAVDIARFVPLQTFTAEVDRHVRDLRASHLLPGFDAIRLPGERRAACRDERVRGGVPVPAPLLAQLDKLAAELQIKPLRAR